MARVNYSHWNDGTKTADLIITQKTSTQKTRTRDEIENELEKTHSEIERLRNEFSETKNNNLLRMITKKGDHLVELTKELLSL